MPDRVAAPAPPGPPAMVEQCRTHWGIELGRHRFAVTRVRERRVSGVVPAIPSPARRAAGPLAVGAFASLSAFGLLVAGAFASSRSVEPTRYTVSLPVPLTRVQPAIAPPRPAPVAFAARPRTPRPSAAPAAPLPFQSPLEADDAPYVALALRTGEFQEWTDPAGQRRFLTAGPARLEAGRHCRDLALLIRGEAGPAHVRSLHRCTSEPVSDAAMPDLADDEAEQR